MVKDIVRYPTPPSVEFATDVRQFDEALFSLIEDLKDTITENNLDGLAAFQIGSYFNVVVVKDEDGEFLELINPRIFTTEGKVTTTETTAYFPGLSAEVTRYDKISLVYQDREGKQHSLQAQGALSILLQRKIDYTFGAHFLSKLSKEEKAKFEKKLEFGADVAISETCPTTFKRDYFPKIANIALIVMALLLVGSLFVGDKAILESMWSAQEYLFATVVLLNIVYFFYAHYEAKRYTSCISCQTGNIIGTMLVSIIKLILIMVISYFLINPN